MMTWYTFPKQEGNNCKECKGTGKIQWFDIDGGTIYHWMKPNVKDCECQKEKPVKSKKRPQKPYYRAKERY